VQPFSFLTNHGLVMLCIAHDQRARIRDIAASVGITERAAQRIVADLIEAGYVDRTREGRRNVYTVNRTLRLALPTQRDVDLNSLLDVLVPSDTSVERRDLIADRG
jgi:DNA-binding MarR family transcriptional regulator